MRLIVLAVGRLKAGPERELVTRYKERTEAACRGLGFRSADSLELEESRARRPADRKAEECEALLAAAQGRLVLFDERGKTMASEDFAGKLGQWRDQGTEATTFIIGGADGLSETLTAKADLRLSFGAMTMPHQIVRILVWEQLYRATTILGGHPYHRV